MVNETQLPVNVRGENLGTKLATYMYILCVGNIDIIIVKILCFPKLYICQGSEALVH